MTMIPGVPIRQGVHRLRAGDNGLIPGFTWWRTSAWRNRNGSPVRPMGWTPPCWLPSSPTRFKRAALRGCTSKVVETMLMKAGLSPIKDRLVPRDGRHSYLVSEVQSGCALLEQP